MNRWTKTMVMAAVFALPLLAANFAGADDRPHYGRQGIGVGSGYCQGARVNNADVACDRTQARATLRADIRQLRHDRRANRLHRMELRHGYGHGHGNGRHEACGNRYGGR